MFSKIPPFFSMPNAAPAGVEAAPSFAGMPLVNPLLNDAQANIDTIDERIQQLESVAQWLNLNLQMVNTSVQQLQVQKQTLLALAQWQELSKSTMESLSKINPFAETEQQDANPEATQTEAQKEHDSNQSPKGTKAKASKRVASKKSEADVVEKTNPLPDEIEAEMPAMFEKMAQTWWEGLQNQFAQLAQPLVETAQAAANGGEAKVEAKPAAAPKRKAKAPVAKPKAAPIAKAQQ